jgi:ABC-2 type transport system permease protein
MDAPRVIYTIWLREFKTFLRERSRIFSMIIQPLLYLFIVGQGISGGMRLNAAPGGIDYLQFMYPGIIGMSILFTTMFSAISIIWDREFGFLKEVLVAPVPRWGVAVGKMLGGATVAVIQSLILITLAPFLGITLSIVTVLEVMLLVFIMSFAISGLGVLIAARMRSTQGFQGIMGLMIMPLFFLSGALFPIESAPSWMKPLMMLDPLTYGVDGIRNVIFADTQVTLPQGIQTSLVEVAKTAGLIRLELAHDIGIMALIATLLAILGAINFSRAD